MIFETHAHYDDERFEEDRDALITSMPGRGVGTIINVGASIESTKNNACTVGEVSVCLCSSRCTSERYQWPE